MVIKMTKKNFNGVNNPALQFMSTPETEDMNTAESQTNNQAEFKGLKRGRKPSTEETKSKRLNLLMLPSTCEDLTKIAAMKRTSVNDLINSISKDYITANQDLIEKYNKVFGEE